MGSATAVCLSDDMTPRVNRTFPQRLSCLQMIGNNFSFLSSNKNIYILTVTGGCNYKQAGGKEGKAARSCTFKSSNHNLQQLLLISFGCNHRSSKWFSVGGTQVLPYNQGLIKVITLSPPLFKLFTQCVKKGNLQTRSAT